MTAGGKRGKTDNPNCSTNRFGRNAALTVVALCMATCSFTCYARCAPKPTVAEADAGAKKKPKIALELLNYRGSSDKYSTTIEGRVRNNTDKTYAYVRIVFSLHDRSGNQVGTAEASFENLGPGAIWKFKATSLTPSSRFRVLSLSGS